MAWITQETHKEETEAVKAALKAAGINARVTHGKGTAWGWLEVNVGRGNGYLRPRVIEIAQTTTGRHGHYNGDILVLAQDRWDNRRKRSIPILQPGQVQDQKGD